MSIFTGSGLVRELVDPLTDDFTVGSVTVVPIARRSTHMSSGSNLPGALLCADELDAAGGPAGVNAFAAALSGRLGSRSWLEAEVGASLASSCGVPPWTEVGPHGVASKTGPRYVPVPRSVGVGLVALLRAIPFLAEIGVRAFSH